MENTDIENATKFMVLTETSHAHYHTHNQIQTDKSIILQTTCISLFVCISTLSIYHYFIIIN